MWNDDVLIAPALEYKTDRPAEETVLVTDDTGGRLRCRPLGVRTLRLAEKYRMPPELDEEEKETRRLQRELQKLQDALPKLTIGLAI